MCLSLVDAQFQPRPINLILRTLQTRSAILQLLVYVVSRFPKMRLSQNKVTLPLMTLLFNNYVTLEGVFGRISGFF